jgi:hypothetical protein
MKPTQPIAWRRRLPQWITIINQTRGQIESVTEQRISATERALIIREVARMVAGDRGPELFHPRKPRGEGQ